MKCRRHIAKLAGNVNKNKNACASIFRIRFYRVNGSLYEYQFPRTISQTVL